MKPLKLGFLLVFLAVGGALASVSAKNDRRIFVLNEGAYSAKFSLSYDLSEESKSEYSGELKHGESKVIGVPREAANVHLNVEKLGLKGPQTIFTKDFTNPPQKCYKLDGTLLSSGYEEISCFNVEQKNSEMVPISHKNAEIRSRQAAPSKNANEEDGYISIENQGAYNSFFWVTYELNGKSENVDSGDFGYEFKEKRKTVKIPSGATNVLMQVKEYLMLGTTEVFNQSFSGPMKKCYKLEGTLLKPTYFEFPCGLKKTLDSQQAASSENANEEGGYILMKNEGESVARFSVSYDLNDNSASHSSETLTTGVSKIIPLPSGATNVYLKTVVISSSDPPKTVFTQHFPGPVKRHYSIQGFEVIPRLSQSVHKMLSSSKETHYQQVASSVKINDGYITIVNNGEYVAYFSVSYELNGIPALIGSGEFGYGLEEKSKTVNIPSGATNIFLRVRKYWLAGNSDVFNQSFVGPVRKCYKLEGTNLQPTYAEIACPLKETSRPQQTLSSQKDNDNVGYISVANNGDYNLVIDISYELNSEAYQDSSREFTSGVTKTLPIPSGATNVFVIVRKYELIGMPTIFSEYFPGPVKKCYKVSGSSINPSHEEISCPTNEIYS